MAKRGRKPGPQAVAADKDKGNVLSASLAKIVDAIRKPFMAFAQQHGAMLQRRAELAPQFMAAFGDWQKETGRGAFVEFCRVIDPSIPVERDGYRAHASYQAADYLRRLVGRTDQGNGRATPVRSSSMALARLLATILPLVREKEHDAVWAAVEAEFGFRRGQVVTLQRMTAATQPFLELHAKPQPVKVIHVVAPQAEQAEVAA